MCRVEIVVLSNHVRMTRTEVVGSVRRGGKDPTLNFENRPKKKTNLLTTALRSPKIRAAVKWFQEYLTLMVYSVLRPDAFRYK